MKRHDEPDQLSAYLDGELPDGDRRRIERHVARCRECRSALGALRATLSDLALLAAERPAMTEQESWALRARVDRSRTRVAGPRLARWAPAVGAVAATVVAVLAITLPGSDGPRRGNSGAGSTALEAVGPADAPPLELVAKNYDERSAARLLDQTAYPVSADDAAAGAPAATFGARERVAGPEAQNLKADADPHLAQRATECANSVRTDSDEPLTPVAYRLASYKSRPAFLFVFRATQPSRLELWVTDAKTCRVLFFHQKRAG